MADRLDPSPLIQALGEGLRKRRQSGDEPPDRVTRWVLLGAPLLVFGLVLGFCIVFPAADQLLAACALLAGALLTAFAQVASWRERILSRHRRVDAVDIRALNEAAAHILISLMGSVVASAAVFVLANLDLKDESLGVQISARFLSALSASLFTYIAISLLIVGNLLWDALTNEEREAKRESLRRENQPNDTD